MSTYGEYLHSLYGRGAGRRVPPGRDLYARVAAWEAELDYARRAEQRAQVERQARENAQLLQQVGSGALALCALTLNDMIDSTTGELKRDVEVRDLCGLMKAGSDLLALATGSPTQIVGTGDNVALERILRDADPETKQAVINGLRAALAWQERTKRGGQ